MRSASVRDHRLERRRDVAILSKGDPTLRDDGRGGAVLAAHAWAGAIIRFIRRRSGFRGREVFEAQMKKRRTTRS